MAKPVIPVSRAKEHLRVQHDLDDSAISLFAEAAMDRALAEIGLAGELELNREVTVPSAVSIFPLPVKSILSVKKDGVEMDAEDWELAGNSDAGQTLTIAEAEWSTASVFTVSYEPGWVKTPAWLEVACLFLIAHYYVNRSSTAVAPGIAAVEIPMGFHHLLNPHKRILFA